MRTILLSPQLIDFWAEKFFPHFTIGYGRLAVWAVLFQLVQLETQNPELETP